MTTLPRPPLVVRLAAALGLGILLVLLSFHVGVSLASADPLTTSAPVTQGLATAQSGWDLVETYGPIWGAMLLVFGLVSRFLQKNQSEHWIAEGRTLAALVAGVGVLGSVLEAQLGGASWSGVVVTLFGAAKMLLSPTVKPAGEKPPPAYGSISLLMVLVAVGIACSPIFACGAP
jgi:hypothetical protein